ncbi:hypothetical protein [Deinococcus cellulosilyticus]|uniref:Uncharacterized protein n=1 Tax=Deinococcus cellulosilyticus (strain DSM 18568 / NBRC 106333 / KACC 11606 / 5516J-15) TaxID=1223518 RepID=A0A511MYT5_DEIC1|nr:hypothetical protein [Deinococcus cellulosilyticus]GEM45307.1 hypothetical protein DC3_09420 [Deinococcus cellulosilyticus NBRC 106333 = KACC 11606]
MKKKTQSTLLLLTGLLAVGAVGLVAWNMFGSHEKAPAKGTQVEPKPSTGSGSNDQNPNKGGGYNPITGEGSYGSGDKEDWYVPDWEDRIKDWWKNFTTPGDPPAPPASNAPTPAPPPPITKPKPYNPITGEGSYT